MSKLQKVLVTISRIIIGTVFIYSGFVKGIDPLGGTYKFNDYFTVFSAHWATSFSFFLSVILSMAEFIVGIALLLNLKVKIASWGALLLMIIFTPLTLYIAITSPVHDCGCFGDALVITNWQTFWKNVVLMVLVLFVFNYRKKIDSKLRCWEQWAIVAVIAVVFGLLIQYSYQNLPLLDFRPFKIGTHIPSKMVIPDDAPQDVWESSFIYSKNGEEKEFGLKELPDSTWTFVDAKHHLVTKGYEPPIHDFMLTSKEGDDVTQMILNNDQYTFLLIAHNLEKYNFDNQHKIKELVEYCHQSGINFYGITASNDEVVTEFVNQNGILFEFLHADDITLKTIIRANPGILLLKSGTVIDMWHHNNVPEAETLAGDLTSYSLSKYKKSADNFYILLLIASFGLSITLYLQLRKAVCKKYIK